MKVYIHFEEITKRMLVSGDDPDSALIYRIKERFIEHYNGNPANKSEDDLYPDQLALYDENDRELLNKWTLSDAKIASGADLFMKPRPLEEKREEKTGKKLLGEAQDLCSRMQFKSALEMCHVILGLDPANSAVRLIMGTIYARIKKYERAVEQFEIALRIRPHDQFVLQMLAEAYRGAKNFEKAFQAYQELYGLTPESDIAQRRNLQVRMGETLYDSGQAAIGVQLVADVLNQTQKKHPEALFVYARATMQLGNVPDALRLLLHVIIAKPDDSDARALLAKALGHESAIRVLQEDFTDRPSTAPAFAFLALIAKDHGVMDISLWLYKTSLEFAPTRATYALNYVHALETVDRHEDALEALSKFLADNPNLSVGRVKCSAILKILQLVATPKMGVPPRKFSLDDFPPPDPIKGDYSKDDLDLLAVFFTAAKILYVVGQYTVVAVLTRVLNPLRRRAGETGDRPLHLTDIRNEHAYFCSVSAMAEHHPTIKSVDESKVVYAVGDSHCMPPAWARITLRDQECTIVPRLVTGLKMWHLRPESSFYPKINFEKVAQSVPPKADVIMIFGEIDCREGILLAVEQAKYESFEDGANHVVSFYLDTLRSYNKDKEWRIYIHPVVPVLNETRHMVKRFNTVLRARVEAETDFAWLDFFDKLLTPDGSELNKDYALDGTHLSPKYVAAVLEPALDKLQKT